MSTVEEEKRLTFRERVTELVILVKRIVELGVNPDTIKKNGEVPLCLASYYGHTESVKRLLDANANPDTVDKEGKTAIYYASCYGYTDIVKLLLKANANPCVTGTMTHTPLIIASYCGHTEVVKLLLDAGAFKYYPEYKRAVMRQYFTKTETVVGNVKVYTRPLYKKVRNNGNEYIITLKLPVNAESNIGRLYDTDPISDIKYRASCMYVVQIECNGELINSVHNSNEKGVTYTVGSMVYPDQYDPEPYKVCTSGIHFFMDRASAERY